MVAGFNMFSFDLFGLAHRAQDARRLQAQDKETKPHPRDAAEQDDRDKEHELFFWSLYPVI